MAQRGLRTVGGPRSGSGEDASGVGKVNGQQVLCHAELMHAVDEERDLVQRMRAGEEAAFESFSDHYIGGLYRFAAARLGADRELARDVVAATVCKVIERLDSYRGEAPLFTWLCACLRNEIAEHFRRRQGRPTVDLELAGEAQAGSPSPEDRVMQMESNALVHQALDQLPPRYASALQWKYLEGRSVDEIADRLELGLKAAESVLTRARQAFRGTYEQLAGKRQ